MGRTGINSACTHPGAIGLELTGYMVGHGRKGVLYLPLLLYLPLPSAFCIIIFFVEFSGEISIFDLNGVGEKSRGERQKWMRRIANLFQERGSTAEGSGLLGDVAEALG